MGEKLGLRREKLRREKPCPKTEKCCKNGCTSLGANKKLEKLDGLINPAGLRRLKMCAYLRSGLSVRSAYCTDAYRLIAEYILLKPRCSGHYCANHQIDRPENLDRAELDRVRQWTSRMDAAVAKDGRIFYSDDVLRCDTDEVRQPI